MADDAREKVPGVTLWYESSLMGAAHAGLRHGELTLRYETTDDELWQVVEKKFREGFRVYKEDDFHIQVMDVMRDRIKELEEALVLKERDLNQAVFDKKKAEDDAAALRQWSQAFPVTR